MGNSDKSLRDQKRHGYSLPVYLSSLKPESQTFRSQHQNPFPQLNDLRCAYTLPHLKAYWFPIIFGSTMSVVDEAIYFCHESIHLLLTDTKLGLLTLLLHQIQYTTIMKAVATSSPIYTPSLTEPTGVLANAQMVLDSVLSPLIFVHEVVATTLVQFLIENNHLLMTHSLGVAYEQQNVVECKRLGFDFNYTPYGNNAESYIDPQFARFAINSAEYRNRAQELESDVINFYHDMLPEFDFSRYYKQLLETWRKIGGGLDEEETLKLIYYILSRYPFEAPRGLDLQSLMLWNKGLISEAWLEAISSFVTEMREEPLKRLDTLIAVIKSARKRRDANGWKSYLLDNLPDIAEVPMTYSRALTTATHLLWQEVDNKFEAEKEKVKGKIEPVFNADGSFADPKSSPSGRLAFLQIDVAASVSSFFRRIYTTPFGQTVPLVFLPIGSNFDKQIAEQLNSPGFKEELIECLLTRKLTDRIISVSESLRRLQGLKVVFGLESVRQSLVEGHALPCFCERENHYSCDHSFLLRNLWKLMILDLDYESDFQRYWQKPECI